MSHVAPDDDVWVHFFLSNVGQANRLKNLEQLSLVVLLSFLVWIQRDLFVLGFRQSQISMVLRISGNFHGVHIDDVVGVHQDLAEITHLALVALIASLAVVQIPSIVLTFAESENFHVGADISRSNLQQHVTPSKLLEASYGINLTCSCEKGEVPVANILETNHLLGVFGMSSKRTKVPQVKI